MPGYSIVVEDVGFKSRHVCEKNGKKRALEEEKRELCADVNAYTGECKKCTYDHHLILNSTCVPQCPPSHVASQGKCIPNCPISTFFSEGKCQPCKDKSCLECSSQSECTRCKPDTDCVLSCKGIYDYSLNKCVEKCDSSNSFVSLSPSAGFRIP